MDRVEAPQARQVELSGRVEQVVVEFQEVDALQQRLRPRDRPVALRSDRPYDLNAREPAGDPTRVTPQIAAQCRRSRLADDELYDRGRVEIKGQSALGRAHPRQHVARPWPARHRPQRLAKIE